MYRDIEREREDRCVVCRNKLEDGDSPWSICFDPEWKRNCWGGDSHEYRALLCQGCAENMIGG